MCAQIWLQEVTSVWFVSLFGQYSTNLQQQMCFDGKSIAVWIVWFLICIIRKLFKVHRLWYCVCVRKILLKEWASFCAHWKVLGQSFQSVTSCRHTTSYISIIYAFIHGTSEVNLNLKIQPRHSKCCWVRYVWADQSEETWWGVLKKDGSTRKNSFVFSED